MIRALATFEDFPLEPPLLDRAAVEQARLVRLARQHLASTQPSVDYDGLAEGRGCSVLAARQWVKRHRTKGQLFVVEYDGGTLIPTFQLDQAFDVDAAVGVANARLASVAMSGWAMWQWWTAVNAWIEQRPIDVIGTPALDTALAGLLDA